MTKELIDRAAIARRMKKFKEDGHKLREFYMKEDLEWIRAELEPGQVLPERHDEFVHESMANSFAKEAYSLRDSALADIDSEMTKLEDRLCTAPSDTGARYITAISSRDNMTKGEVEAALSRYAGDYAIERAVRDAAKRSGLNHLGGRTSVEREIADLREVRRIMENDLHPTSLMHSSRGKDGFLEALGGGLDSYGEGRSIAREPTASFSDAIDGGTGSDGTFTIVW